ncbi:MAG: ABC transporter ATP-binding protein [bacterium]|nr:ABC transporter ATP-binding protein [bacterium]
MKEIIRIENISKYYSVDEVRSDVINGANFSANEGELVVILGVSGSGKTTLLNLIGGLDSPNSGKITVDGTELTRLDRDELTYFRRDKVGFIFQFYNLLPTLTAEENIEAGLEILPWSRDEIKTAAKEYLGIVGLSDKKNKFPSQLSGGEQQRVAIARALAKKPKLILADEPTGNLDIHTGEKIISTLKDLNKNFNTTLIIVTHNPKIGEIADRVVHIEDGKVTEKK